MLGVVVEPRKRRAIVILKNFRCRWSKCSFCPFYLEASSSLEDVVETNDRILKMLERALQEHDIGWISVFNGGSFYELPLDVVLKLSSYTRGRVVDIETRPEYLDTERVLATLSILQPKTLQIRVGFEVWNEELRNAVLRKGIPQSEVFRLAELRKELQKLVGDRVKFFVYVLFGIEGVDEEEVKRSVLKFSELFDGVIAVRYRRVLPHHPREVRVSEDLLKFLEARCLAVDVGEGEEWVFDGTVRYVVA